MPHRGDRARLINMLDSAVEARELVRGRTRADLDTDQVVMLALDRLLEVVGESELRSLLV